MYYNPNLKNHWRFKSKLYISKYIETIQDEDFNQKKVYATPKKYFFNVQPVNAESEIREFGDLVSSMKVAVITQTQKYYNKFKEFDLAYLDEASPIGEVDNGDNANYRIYAIRNQNTIIKVYFLKVVQDH